VLFFHSAPQKAKQRISSAGNLLALERANKLAKRLALYEKKFGKVPETFHKFKK
jgi:hypothetical protein